MNTTEVLTDELRLSWIKMATSGAIIFQKLQESQNLFPSREQWEFELQKQSGGESLPFSPIVLDALWQDADAAGREFDRVGGKQPLADIVRRKINWERVKIVAKLEKENSAAKQNMPTPTKIVAVSKKPQTGKQNIMSKKKILVVAAVSFALTGIMPPWQFTADRNGNYGFHSRQPAGYALIFDPPTNPEHTAGNGVQIDYGRLFLEWAVLAVATGMVWVLVVKPAWTRDEKSISSKEFIAPSDTSKN
jgi:hypothetical protein